MSINCFECQNKNKKQFMYTTCSELVLFMYWTGKSMNNLLSYWGVVDARISASETDLSVPKLFWPTVRKKNSSDREKLLKFKAFSLEFQKISQSLEQFV